MVAGAFFDLDVVLDGDCRVTRLQIQCDRFANPRFHRCLELRSARGGGMNTRDLKFKTLVHAK